MHGVYPSLLKVCIDHDVCIRFKSWVVPLFIDLCHEIIRWLCMLGPLANQVAVTRVVNGL